MQFLECYKTHEKVDELLACRINVQEIVAMYPEPIGAHFAAAVKTTDGEVYWLEKESDLTLKQVADLISIIIDSIQ